jgi:hypothetical protein
VVTGTDFVDGEVDSAEIQASYENGKKALDNQLVGGLLLRSPFNCKHLMAPMIRAAAASHRQKMWLHCFSLLPAEVLC